MSTIRTMKIRYTLIIYILAALNFTCLGQIVHSDKPLNSTTSLNSNAGKFNVGVKIGCPWSMMYFSDLRQTLYTGKVGYLGGFVFEYKQSEKFSLGLDATFALKGTNMQYNQDFEIGYSVINTAQTQMELSYSALRLRLPFSFYLNPLAGNNNARPYLFVAPEFEYDLAQYFDFSGNGTSAFHYTKTNLTSGTLMNEKYTPMSNMMNASIVLGGGIQMKVPTENSFLLLKFDAALFAGLINQATPQESGRNITCHGAEINATILFPLKKRLQGACIKWGQYN